MGVRIEDHVKIRLSDGVYLSARIWFPPSSEPCPAILEYHPYPKRYTTAKRDEIAHACFAERGYVALRVDMRGSGDSGGVMSNEYTTQERSDAVEVIEWISRQSWCSGNVGMYGLSWGGFNSLQLAALAPKPLKAVAVAGATDDQFREDAHFMGGVMASDHIGWAATLFSFLTRPPDPAIVGRNWKSMWRRRLDALDWMLPIWLQHPARDEYWTEGFPCASEPGLRVPTLAAGGIADVFATSVLRMVSRQPETVKAIIGPWAHKFPNMGIPGPAIDWIEQCVRWFDHWLKDKNNGVELDPPLRAFVCDSYEPDENSTATRPGRWHVIPTSESAAPEMLTMPLGALGTLGGTLASGKITIATAHNLGLDGGEIMPMGWGADLPGDQRRDDALSVCFETAPLDEALTVFGQPHLSLQISRDQRQGFCAARLCDVAPDDSSTRVGIGAQNLELDDSFAAISDFVPGQAQDTNLMMSAVAHRFEKGHRIRLALSTAYWPMLWPAPTNGALTLELKGSSLNLPLLPAAASDWNDFGPADGCTPLPRSVLSEASFERTYTRDVANRSTEFIINDVADHERSDTNGIETTGSTLRTYVVRDESPEEASMHIVRNIGVGRGEWQTSTQVEVLFTGTADEFTWDLKLVARHGNRTVVKKQFSGRAPRSP